MWNFKALSSQKPGASFASLTSQGARDVSFRARQGARTVPKRAANPPFRRHRTPDHARHPSADRVGIPPHVVPRTEKRQTNCPRRAVRVARQVGLRGPRLALRVGRRLREADSREVAGGGPGSCGPSWRACSRGRRWRRRSACRSGWSAIPAGAASCCR